MNPDAYWHILAASLAGGVTGALVVWNRNRAELAGKNRIRQVAVLTAGTAASACALYCFAQALGAQSRLFAAVLMILMTSWAAVLQAVVRLPTPRSVLRVSASEFAVLRAPWTGVRLFGALLRNTPLRHLGGRVYLAEAGRDPLAVLRGLHDAENVHLWALLFCGPWLAFWGAQGEWHLVACGVAVHVPLNVYPILHLRYVTPRVEAHVAKARRRREARAAASRS